MPETKDLQQMLFCMYHKISLKQRPSFNTGYPLSHKDPRYVYMDDINSNGTDSIVPHLRNVIVYISSNYRCLVSAWQTLDYAFILQLSKYKLAGKEDNKDPKK